MTKRATILALFAAVLFGDALAAQEFQVIVNTSNGMSSVSKQRLSRIFLKKTTRWDDGDKIAPVDQVTRSSLRQRFSSQVHGKAVRAVESYWQEQIFSGRSTPPPQLGSSGEVLSFVRSNPDAIGYVSGTTTVGNGVKVITLTQ